MKKILYVNSCFKEGSRTNELAQHLLSSLDGEIESVNLYEENIRPLDAQMLSKRDELLESGKTDDDFLSLARQFASADIIMRCKIEDMQAWELMSHGKTVTVLRSDMTVFTPKITFLDLKDEKI